MSFERSCSSSSLPPKAIVRSPPPPPPPPPTTTVFARCSATTVRYSSSRGSSHTAARSGCQKYVTPDAGSTSSRHPSRSGALSDCSAILRAPPRTPSCAARARWQQRQRRAHHNRPSSLGRTSPSWAARASIADIPTVEFVENDKRHVTRVVALVVLRRSSSKVRALLCAFVVWSTLSAGVPKVVHSEWTILADLFRPPVWSTWARKSGPLAGLLVLRARPHGHHSLCDSDGERGVRADAAPRRARARTAAHARVPHEAWRRVHDMAGGACAASGWPQRQQQ
jgi:hypothetical protein